MATSRMSCFLRQVTRGMAAQTLADLADRELIQHLLAGPDEAAFEALVRRHGPMVYRVCWRVLQQVEDCEDAFQATFLVLARKLPTVKKRDSLASWLHGVAHRVALDAKKQASRRRCHEGRLPVSSDGPPDEIAWREVRAVLDAELARLPEKLRSPLILCYLEGQSQEEAARQLGWSKRTLQRRLEEGRSALGHRLTHKGFVWSAALTGVLLSDCVAPAALSSRFIGSTVEAAASAVAGRATAGIVSANVTALVEGVVKAMFMSKIKFVAIVVVFGSALLSVPLGLAGGRLITWSGFAAAQPPQDSPPPKALATKPRPATKPRLVDAGAAVDAVAWSPDGKLMATEVKFSSPTRDGGAVPTGRALQLRDAKTGAVRRTLYEEDNVWDVRFSPDGKSVAAALSGENVVKLWDPATGKEQRIFQGVNIPGASLTNIAFSRDGRLIAAAGRVLGAADQESNGAVILWETGSGKLLWQVRGHKSDHWDRAVAFSPDGKLLATGTGGTIKLWDTATGKCKQTLRGHDEVAGAQRRQKGVWSLAFSPDGKLLASGGVDGTVRLWDPESGQLKYFVTSGYVLGWPVMVAFSPDGKRLAVGGTALGSEEPGRGDIRLFDARTGKLERAFTDLLRYGVSRGLAFSPDGEWLAVGADKQLLLLPLQK